jgi:D-glycero-alpha-D-manno-heptose-7-phosphate kinase
MIISKTPFRISFVGGGSDLAAFYEEFGGAVLSTSINKYMYISSHCFFEEDKIRTKYSITETVDNVEALKHPILKESLKLTGIKGGIEISSIADVPSGTGMGSSSSFTVGVLHNLYAYTNQFVSKEQLAHQACEIEIGKLGEPIGKQDQYAAAYGGLNVIEFHKDGRVSVLPIHLSKDTSHQLESDLLMFYVGNQRKASDILSEQKKNTKQADKVKTLQEMVSLVYELRNSLYAGNLENFGALMHQNWLLKKALASGISNSVIDDVYTAGMKAGALGGKLLGAGGGGFMLFYCPKERQSNLRLALKDLKEFDFHFDKDGSKIIYYGQD